ncbi:hypothetical protein SFUMM280S_04692 [Streptomyces fumanus]
MHHGAERPVGGDRGEQAGQRVAVGGVAGGDLGPGPVRGEVVEQFGAARGVGAAAAGEQQVPYAVAGGEVDGDQPAEGAGAAGDQHGAVGAERRARRGGRLAVGVEAGGEEVAVAQGDDRFAAAGDGGQRPGPGGRVGLREVGQEELVGVLGLGGAQQPPGGGGRQVGDVLAGDGGHRAGGRHDQPGRGEAGLGGPGAQHLQQAGGGAVGGLGEEGAVRCSRYGVDDGVGGGGSAVQGRDQLGDVGEGADLGVRGAQGVRVAVRVGAEDGPVAGGRGVGGGGDGHPVQAVQRVGGAVRGGRGGRGGVAGDEGVDPGDRAAVGSVARGRGGACRRRGCGG